MAESFQDVHKFLFAKGSALLGSGGAVKTSNSSNTGTMKEELVELPHQFFYFENPSSTIFDLKSFKTLPWWMVGEVVSEFLNLNPPLMSRYREDIINGSYKMMPDGTMEYSYGSRWKEFNQLEAVRQRLTANPTTKRAIIQTWMPYDPDLNRADSPCNVNYMFLARDKKLDMTATIRSNDIMRGTKYDYFLASFMLQSMAALTNQEVGKLYFHINSLHYYTRDANKLEEAVNESMSVKPISISLPKTMEVEKYWNDLRHIKKSEEAAYNGAFDYAQKHIGDINYPIFRDFGRILGLRNSQFVKNDLATRAFQDEIETPEVRRWIGI